MKPLSILALAVLTCSNMAFAGHLRSGNCEIFIDKIVPTTGSHGSASLYFYVKTLNAKLDGRIAEVGFRYKALHRGHGRSMEDGWQNLRLEPFANSEDYWMLSLPSPVASDFGNSTFTGSFYVRTDRDTNYWFNAPDGADFVIDSTAFRNVFSALGKPYSYSNTLENAVPTQQSSMSYYNPAQCY